MYKFIIFLFLINISYITSAQIIELKPIRKVYIGGLLGNIESHMPINHRYREFNKIGWMHETTHGLHARLRNQYGNNVFYLLNNQAIVVKEPPFTLRYISTKIPHKLRRNIYNLYLINAQQWWNNEPLYIFDEWVAYTNGTLTGQEYKIFNIRTQSSFQHTLELTEYAYVLMQEASKYKEYDITNLHKLFDLQLKRVFDIYDNAKKKGWLTHTHKQYMDMFLRNRIVIIESKITPSIPRSISIYPQTNKYL